MKGFELDLMKMMMAELSFYRHLIMSLSDISVSCGPVLIFVSVSVRGMLEGLQPAGEPEDASEVAHRGEALHVRVSRLHQGILQRLGQGQASEQDPFKRGKRLTDMMDSDARH